jgi:uncharacterized protein (DUF2141 family)
MHDTHRTPSFGISRRSTLLAVVCATPAAMTAFAGDLTIEISGIAPNRGKIYVALYDQPEAFPIAGRQRVGQIVPAEAAHLTVRFNDLPKGRYAVVAFQDLNGNGKLDKNLLGMPKEPYGFSNSARGTAGPPKFHDAAVTLDADGATSIVLK